MTRPDGRSPEGLRPVSIEPGFLPHAEGSVLIGMIVIYTDCDKERPVIGSLSRRIAIKLFFGF